MLQERGSILIVETDPATDTYEHMLIDKIIMARLLSVRCREAYADSLPNQDYVKMLSCRDGSSLVFCVCDGVGSSYKGNFAAQYLAGYLVQWLQGLNGLTQDAVKLTTILQSQLDQLSRSAQMALRKITIPAETPPLVREVLEDLRDSYGSEAVFFCGRIDRGGGDLSVKASCPVQALFCWMGNISARLFGSTDHIIDLGDRDNDLFRWSTKHGCRGKLITRSMTFSTLDRLVVYTDGFSSIAETYVDLDDKAWKKQVQRLLKQPSHDDRTVLDLRWLSANADERWTSGE